MKKNILFVSILSSFSSLSFAQQAVLIDLGEHNPALVKQSISRSNQVCPETHISLPFFDDFANNDNGYYPSCSHWTDNHAFINNEMAYNPPSVGTATLDGLDPTGYPYNKFVSPNVGYAADTLTSQLINLSSYNSGSNVALSFFYQPQGLCDRPEAGDSLILELRDSSNTWNQVFAQAGLTGLPATVLTDFVFQYLDINDGIYLHDSFQFRFRNLASITGNNDHWHIDYVYLDAGRSNTAQFPDVAFTHIPVSPLLEYTAVPWQHFNAGLWKDTMEMRTFNRSNVAGTLDREYTVYDTNPLTELLYAPIPAVTYAPSPNANDLKTGGFLGSFQPFAPTAPTFLESTYTILDPTAFQNNPIYAQNDTVRRTTVLDNYYAYDDGTAEMRIVAQGIGSQIAVEFVSQIADTLRGIYFHLPHFINRDAELDYVNVKVWLDSVQNEVFSLDIYRLRYVDGFNGLHYVELRDFAGNKTPIALNAGQKFYIGWQQASTTNVPIGYDRSTDATHKTFFGTGAGQWSPIDVALTPLLPGAVMIRPLVSIDSNYSVIPVRYVPDAPNISLKTYPNPAHERLNLTTTSNAEIPNESKVLVTNSLGQTIYFANFTPQINVSNWAQGVYCLTLILPNQQRTSTIIAIE